MTWLSYTDDEVEKFHPFFEQSANEALKLEGLAAELEWIHHIKTPGSHLKPDYVLRRTDTKRWLLAVEIKRKRASVHSTRNQIQAKGYAEEYSDQYLANAPKYFAISNLETTLLFALRGSVPPSQCRLLNGVYEAGTFSSTSEEQFKTDLAEIIRSISRRVCELSPPEFDQVWPAILDNFIKKAEMILGKVPLVEPTTRNWNLVRNYFCHDPAVDGARIALLRCLLAEYLRGVLNRFSHPKAGTLLPITADSVAKVGIEIANALTRIREIDFRQLFEESVQGLYRSLAQGDAGNYLREYILDITTPPSRIEELARTRLDREELLDGIVWTSHSGEDLDEMGKVLTDPELAALLSCLSVQQPGCQVLDPCGGDGALLDSAYDRLKALGAQHGDILSSLRGIEADPLLVRLAALRLLLHEPASVSPESSVDVQHGDMFTNQATFSNADVILMNPPFKRYEAQNSRPVPAELREHYASEIKRIAGVPSIAIEGQQNLYTFYVEYAVTAAKPGARIGMILDNKWYHNRYGTPLRNLLLKRCAIEAIIEYPRAGLFSDWTIATSILLCRKASTLPNGHQTKFIRCVNELAQIDPGQIALAFTGQTGWPPGWTCREIPQDELSPEEGWKTHFAETLKFDFRTGLTPLPDLFAYGRRGSLAKEEGGMGALAFPFSRRTFGYKRVADPKASRKYQNRRGQPLSKQENERLRQLADAIPKSFRGYAVNNPDKLRHFEFTESDLLTQPTIEPSRLRGLSIFFNRKRTGWTQQHNQALQELKGNKSVRDFICAFRKYTGLNRNLMPDVDLWVGLREPYAGELIVPRKLRSGHRVHINPFAVDQSRRQVRLSSNFISYADCKAVDDESGLDSHRSVRLIAAFLISSFGQLQFEMKGYNREGLLSVEEDHLAKILVLDPRKIPKEKRSEILGALEKVPYPIPMDRLSAEQHERNDLDSLFASVICANHTGSSVEELLAEVHGLLDEYIVARRP